jgi:hypothetical protein
MSLSDPRPGVPMPPNAAGDRAILNIICTGFMTVRIIPPRYLPEPKLGKSFAILDGIGNKANIVEDMGGWNVGAIKGAKAVVIHVDGGKSSRSMAVTMLKKYVQKL